MKWRQGHKNQKQGEYLDLISLEAGKDVLLSLIRIHNSVKEFCSVTYFSPRIISDLQRLIFKGSRSCSLGMEPILSSGSLKRLKCVELGRYSEGCHCSSNCLKDKKTVRKWRLAAVISKLWIAEFVNANKLRNVKRCWCTNRRTMCRGLLLDQRFVSSGCGRCPLQDEDHSGNRPYSFPGLY